MFALVLAGLNCGSTAQLDTLISKQNKIADFILNVLPHAQSIYMVYTMTWFSKLAICIDDV